MVAEHEGFQKQFPDLQLRNGRLHRMLDADSALNLEREYPRPGKPSETNLKGFMNYLNSDGSEVDDVEIDNSARLIWLANNDSEFNAIQVNVAVEITMQKLRRSYDASYDLDGESDMLCTAIADIHHQSRGKKIEVRAALALDTQAKKLEALCQVGSDVYPERCQTLRRSIKAARTAGELGNSVYDRARRPIQAVCRLGRLAPLAVGALLTVLSFKVDGLFDPTAITAVGSFSELDSLQARTEAIESWLPAVFDIG